MDEIRKYSKEWFVQNGTQNQKNAVKNFKDGLNDFVSSIGFFNDDTFLGTKEEVLAKIKQIELKAQDKNYYSEADRIGAYGVDNMFTLLDANEDGKITKDEIADVSAVDTAELEDEVNTKFSVKDLRLIYENVMASDGAEFVKDGNIERYIYKDGSQTEIVKDDSGNVLSKKVEVRKENQSRNITEYSYSDKTKTETQVDLNGVISENVESKDKTKNKTVTVEYTSDNTKITTTKTVGRTIVETIDKSGKISVQQTLNYDSDGKIDDTQQKTIGDCWLLSGVNALRTTKKGAKIIKEAIKQNSDGSVTVTLKGVNKSYTYSPEQIGARQYSTNKSYSIGDTDMNLLEMAIADYRRELISNNENSKFGKFLQATMDDPISGGHNEEALFYLTGIEPDISTVSVDKQKDLDLKRKNQNSYAMTVDFLKEDKDFKDGEIIIEHTYSISKVTKDTVYLVNPHDSSQEIAYPKDKFLQNSFYISSVKL